VIKALVLTHNYPRTADDPVGSFVLRLAVSLRRHDIDTHVLAPAFAGGVLSETIAGIPVTRFHYAPRAWETITYSGTMSTQVRESWRSKIAMIGLLAASYRVASRVAREWGADVMHAHWWLPAGLVARTLKARLSLPYIVTMHGSDLRLAASLPGAGALFRLVSGQASAMTTVSSWLAEQARALDPGCSPIVGPMPVMPELFHPGDRRDDNRILFVGKLTEQKGLHHLLRAMTLMKARPALDVVGAGRVDDTATRKLATDLGLNDRITWYPLLSQAELAALYRNAAIHVIPAVEEGLGLTAVESLLSQTPVVAFRSGGLPDIVIPNETGVLVPAGDVSALAAAIDTLLADPSQRARMGATGRSFALSHFGPDAVAAQYAGLLRAAADSRSRS
jgi:glycosyltransferase involved in cell wall biosynthesis